MAIAGVLPGVGRHLVCLTRAAGSEHDRLRLEQQGLAALASVAEGADDAVSVLEQTGDSALHEHVDAFVHGVLLKSADHLQTRAVANVGEAVEAVTAERALADPAVLRAIEQRAPGLKLVDPLRRLLRVDAGPCASC